jgi:hypothetical protein
VSAISSAPKEHSTDDTFPAASRADAKSNTCTDVAVIASSLRYFVHLGLSMGQGEAAGELMRDEKCEGIVDHRDRCLAYFFLRCAFFACYLLKLDSGRNWVNKYAIVS